MDNARARVRMWRWAGAAGVSRVLTVVWCLLVSACGESIRPLAVIENRAGFTKERIGPVRDASAPMPVMSGVRSANVIGDEAPDRLEAMPVGEGVEIRDGTTGLVTRLPTVEYLTDYAVMSEAGSSTSLLVTLTYPNPRGSGTISVFRLPAVGPRARWDVDPSPERLGVGTWKGEAALFHLQSSAIVAMAADGRTLAKLPVEGAGKFSRIYPGTLAGERTVVLASGDGYTPYHMVAVFDANGQLLYHEQAAEHAWRLTINSDQQTFDVDTRSTRWHYKTR